jgi:hypothetical protein
MHLRSEQEIDAAMLKSYGKVTDDRKRALLATVRSTRPEKVDELDAILSANLPPDELEFYNAIVERDSNGSSAAQSLAHEAA